jgi:vacuolar-type H+-ATPase subunit E/Vma4
LKQKLEKEKKTLWNMHISEGKRRSRHSLLSSKEELILETISATRIKLSDMRGSELVSNLAILLEHAKSALGPDLRVYPIRTIDADIIRGKVPTGEVLKGARDLPQVLKRFEDKDHIGGFVAVSSDGKKVLDMTFHGLIEKNEERIREEISRTLFAE